MKSINLSLQGHVSIDDVIDVGCDLIKVHLDQDTAKTLDMRRDQVVQFVTERSEPAYGFNRGFGHNVKLGVNPSDTATLQENLILSHACGVGDPIDIPVARITMFLRAASLAKGNSGVRSLVVQQIIDFLNAGITPLILDWYYREFLEFILKIIRSGIRRMISREPLNQMRAYTP